MRGLHFLLLGALFGVPAAALEPPVRAYLPVAGRIRLVPSPTPLQPNEAEQAERERRTAKANRRGPLSSRPLVDGTLRVSAGARIDVTAAAQNTFRVIQDDDLRTVLPPADTSVIGEPCAVRAARDVLAVGNWYAARSTDGGRHYAWIDPARQFPTVNGGFCCDQVVIYDPARNLFVWELLYSPDTTTNTVRLAIATAAELEADQWHFVDVTPGGLGFPSRRWLDYPQLALSRDHLYLTANVFEIGRDTFTAAVAVRIPLDDLAAGGPVAMEHVTDSAHFTLTPTQGADDAMYLAAQNGHAFALDVYRWLDTAARPTLHRVNVQPYSPANMSCKGPDGRNWCDRSDDRVMTGWRAGGILGFMWNAAQDTTHPYPYVRVVRLLESTLESTLTPLDEPDLQRADTAYQYPAVAVNTRGHVGGVLAAGGGARAPGAAVFLADDLVANTGVWEVHDVLSGDSGPGNGEWGDFLCARPEFPDASTWVTTAFALRGGNGSSSVHPHVIRMGRERDIFCGPDDPCPDDGEPCTTALCTGGHCSSPPLPDATTCDDANACSLTSTCAAGVCTATDVRDCVDLDPCTLDACDPRVGCVFPGREGYDGVLCAFEAGIGGTTCRTPLPAGVTAAFTRARLLVDRARGTVSRRAQRRQLRAATRALGRARARARAAHVGGICRHALVGTIGNARRRVHSLRIALRPRTPAT